MGPRVVNRRLGQSLQTWLAALVVLAAIAAPAQRTAAPDLDAIVARLEQRQRENHANSRPYTITRQYQIFGSDLQKPNSEVLARLDVLPPDRASYAVLQSSGSGRGVGVVKNVLQHESDAHRNPEEHEISSRNYTFEYAGERPLDGRPCYVLKLTPRRKEGGLVNGYAWIDAVGYQLRRVEGEPAKSPSWWVKKVHLTLRYDDIGGVWTNVESQAVADVRFFGRHTFSSREVSASVGSSVAMNRNLRQARQVAAPRPRLPKRQVSSLPAIVSAGIPLR